MNISDSIAFIIYHRISFVISIITCFSVSFATAQDTIVMRNNTKIIAKITEITNAEIKYKRFDYQNGPQFIANTWDIKTITYANGAKDNFEQIKAPKPTGATVQDLSLQAMGNFKYYYKGQLITQPNMLEIVRNLNDKKINHLIKKTNDAHMLKTTFKYSGIGLGAASFFTLIGVINFKNTTAAISNAPRGRGGRGPNNAAQVAAQKQRRTDAGYLVLGAIASSLLSVSFNISEIKHAHLSSSLYNRYIQE